MFDVHRLFLEIDNKGKLIIDHDFIDLVRHDEFGKDLFNNLTSITKSYEHAFVVLAEIYRLTSLAILNTDKPQEVINYLEYYFSNENYPYINHFPAYIKSILEKRTENKSSGLLFIIDKLKLLESYTKDNAHEKKLLDAGTRDKELVNKYNDTQVFNLFVKEKTLEEFIIAMGTTYGCLKTAEEKIIELKKELELLKNKSKKNKGRNYTYDIALTEEWYKELSNDKDYQNTPGVPYKTKIRQEIIQRFYKKLGSKPSDETIKNHLRKIKNK